MHVHSEKGGGKGHGEKGAMMQTVPLALVIGAEGQPEERTLGTAVPAEGWTLAGTGALECQPSAGTERNWALQCPSQARHWPPVSLPEAPSHHFSVSNCSQITLKMACTLPEANHDLIPPKQTHFNAVYTPSCLRF